MRQFSRKIGQSGQEFLLSVIFSFFLHAIIFTGALLLYTSSTPRFVVPPAYEVTLVGPTAELPQIPPEAAPAPLPKPPEKKVPAKKKAPAHPPSKKGGMPELAKPKPAPEEQPERAEGEAKQPAGQTAPGQPVAVAVTTPSDFKFPPYLAILRDKIERNWNPPPGAKGIKARVEFTVLRSGQVGDARLEGASGNFYFDQAAMRAILGSSPFPPLPEGVFKQYEVFSVDLMERE